MQKLLFTIFALLSSLTAFAIEEPTDGVPTLTSATTIAVEKANTTIAVEKAPTAITVEKENAPAPVPEASASGSITAPTEAATKEIPVKLTTTLYSDEELAARRSIDGEQPVMPANIIIGPSKVTLFGYAQTGYTYKHTNGQTTNAFDITRLILMANAELTKELSFFVMFDAASAKLHEYYAQYAFSSALKVRVGQFKQPYTLENIYPPTILSNIGFDNSVLYMTGIATDPAVGNHVARDAGIMLTGDLLPKNGRPLLNYQIGVFNGTGMSVKENNNQKSVIGMLNYMPTSSLLFSGSFALGTSQAENAKFIGEDGAPMIKQGENYHRQRYALGVEWKGKPLYLRSEYMWGKDAKADMQGAYVDLEYHLIPKKLDLVADYDYLKKIKNDETNTLTLGLQYWLYKQCRIASQFVHTNPKLGKISNAWVTQFQIAF